MTIEPSGRIVTFYSYKGGCGQTMALANIAWILASRGKRVLVVDSDLESPGLHHYFHPFLDDSIVSSTPGVIDIITDYAWEAVGIRERAPDWHLEYARVGLHAVSLNWQGWLDDGALDFLSAGKLHSDYSSSVSAFDWDNFYDRLGGGAFLDALRENMKASYDYVLIDSQQGLNDVADICTVQLPDILVVCFNLNNQSIDGGASVARQIDSRYKDRKIRIFPVPMRLDEGEKEKLDISRSFARSKFSGFPNGLTAAQAREYWPSVEIPYKPFYAFEEILATFGDLPGLPTTLLAAYERLTAAITDGEVTSLGPMLASERTASLNRFARRRIPAPTKIVLTYVPPDRMWADWIEAVLGATGLDVQRQVADHENISQTLRADVDFSQLIIGVLTNAYVHSVKDLSNFGFPALSRNFLPIRVGELVSVPPGWDKNVVNLYGLGRDDAILALMRAVDLPPRLPLNISDSDVRFPGKLARVSNLPGRNSSFTGRADLLEKLRDQLVGGDGGPAVVLPRALHGMGGVGKSQVALEYAYRFMADYDLIWWVPADDVEQVSPTLARLAPPLGIRSSDSVKETAFAVLEKLRAGDVFTRWLLVFDNADDPDALKPFLLGGLGHVLITSFNQDWSRHAVPIEVDVFSRSESIEKLRTSVPGLSTEEAEDIASALGDLPLTIEQAGAWLRQTGMPTATYLAKLDRQVIQVLQDQAAGFPESVITTYTVSSERVAEKSPAGAQLLRLLAFFSPGPISTALIYSEPMLNALKPHDPAINDVIVLASIVQDLNRFALVKVDHSTGSLRIHRLVQAVIRSQMEPAAQRAACRDVQDVLLAARPAPSGAPARLHVDDLDDPGNWSSYDLIWPHLRAADAMDSDREPVRRLLIEWVRYQWKRGDFEASLRLGLELDNKWTNTFGDRDRQTLFLGFHIANVLRSLGRYKEAYSWDDKVLTRQQEVLPPSHPATLMTAGGLAADHRALGRFEEALRLDLDTFGSLKEILGQENLRTLAAANNLAVSYRLNGDSAKARELDHDTLIRRTAVLGPNHPYTLSSAINLARDMREVGEYEESVELLRSTYGTLSEIVGPAAVETLRAATSLATSLRKLGEHAEALSITQDALAQYVKHFDPQTNPDALACRLSLAADYAAHGEYDHSREFTSAALKAYRSILGENHPYTLVAANNLLCYLNADGASREALILADTTLRALEESLGAEHPFALICAMNKASCLLAEGQLTDAEALQRRTLDSLKVRLREDHPDTLACEANLAVTLYRSGRTEQAVQTREALLGKLGRLLGSDHPIARALQQWRCFAAELEPQPI